MGYSRRVFEHKEQCTPCGKVQLYFGLPVCHSIYLCGVSLSCLWIPYLWQTACSLYADRRATSEVFGVGYEIDVCLTLTSMYPMDAFIISSQ